MRGHGGTATATGGGTATTVVTKTAAYNAVNGDAVRGDATAGAFNVTLPAATSGRTVQVKKIDATGNAVTIVGTIDGVVNMNLVTQYQSVTLIANGVAWEVW